MSETHDCLRDGCQYEGSLFCIWCGLTEDDIADTAPPAPLQCMEGEEGCDGPVEYRVALSPTGRSFPRCEKHWQKRLDRQAVIRRRYGGDVAPADFDPTYAGETW